MVSELCALCEPAIRSLAWGLLVYWLGGEVRGGTVNSRLHLYASFVALLMEA